MERSFRGHRAGVFSTCFNPNMKQLISGGADNTVMVWNFKPQLRAFRYAGHRDTVLSVAFSTAHNVIASGSKDTTVRLWTPTAYVPLLHASPFIPLLLIVLTTSRSMAPCKIRVNT